MLEAGLDSEISHLASLCPTNEEHKELLCKSVFLLSNIVAERSPQVLQHLVDSQIYQKTLLPLFQLPECPPQLQLELAFCIGNILINTDFSSLKYFLRLGLLTALVQML